MRPGPHFKLDKAYGSRAQEDHIKSDLDNSIQKIT